MAYNDKGQEVQDIVESKNMIDEIIVKNTDDILILKKTKDTNSAAILEQTCKLEVPHKFSDRIKSIGDRVFNTFSKNFVSERKDEIHASRKRNGTRYDKESKADRKTKKLKGD